MRPYVRHRDTPPVVRKFRPRITPKRARVVHTTVGRRRRYEQMVTEAIKRLEQVAAC